MGLLDMGPPGMPPCWSTVVSCNQRQPRESANNTCRAARCRRVEHQGMQTMHTCTVLKPGPCGIPSRLSSAGGRSILCVQYVPIT